MPGGDQAIAAHQKLHADAIVLLDTVDRANAVLVCGLNAHKPCIGARAGSRGRGPTT